MSVLAGVLFRKNELPEAKGLYRRILQLLRHRAREDKHLFVHVVSLLLLLKASGNEAEARDLIAEERAALCSAMGLPHDVDATTFGDKVEDFVSACRERAWAQFGL
jgi:hypothetical protein